MIGKNGKELQVFCMAWGNGYKEIPKADELDELIGGYLKNLLGCQNIIKQAHLVYDTYKDGSPLVRMNLGSVDDLKDAYPILERGEDILRRVVKHVSYKEGIDYVRFPISVIYGLDKSEHIKKVNEYHGTWEIIDIIDQTLFPDDLCTAVYCPNRAFVFSTTPRNPIEPNIVSMIESIKDKGSKQIENQKEKVVA